MARGFGVAAGLDPEVARPLAARCAELGYDSIWSNDHPGAKGLETLAEFAAAAPAIELGVAVIALDRTPPEEIAADVERLGLDPARLWLGVGAGFSEKPLTRMRESLPRAAREAPRRAPRARRDGAEDVRARRAPSFDGAFFNWMTPEFAAGAREQVEAGAARGGPRDAAGLRLRPHRGRPRRRRAPRQGGVLLPRPPRRLPQPLRPPRRARGHGRRRRRRRRRRPGSPSPPTPPSTRSSSAASPAPRSSAMTARRRRPRARELNAGRRDRVPLRRSGVLIFAPTTWRETPR